MKIKLSPFAENDLVESIDFYNSQKKGLENEFIEDVNKTFEKIKSNHKQFQVVRKDIRRAITSKFRFNIFFIAEKTVAYIIGIFHASRNPQIIEDRESSEENA